VVWAGIHTLFMIRLYRRLGFEVQVLGGSKEHWGALRYPVRFEPKDAVIVVRGKPSAWRARWTGEGDRAPTEAGGEPSRASGPSPS
jgi:hypothetical protein